MTKTYKICIIDDDPEDIQLAKDALMQVDLDIKLDIVDYTNGLDYLNELISFDNNRPPDLILLDIKMPRFDGIDMIRRLRGDKRFTCATLIVLSSSASLSDIEQAYALGANAYHIKPMDFEELCNLTRKILDYWAFTVEHG